ARAFDRVLLEAYDLVAPALDHRPFRHLAIGAERGRVLVLAIPALLPAEIALGGAAIAQLDHPEVERPARVVLGEKALEGGKAFGGEPAADAALILEDVDEIREPLAGVVAQAMRGSEQDAGRHELGHAGHQRAVRRIEEQPANPEVRRPRSG